MRPRNSTFPTARICYGVAKLAGPCKGECAWTVADHKNPSKSVYTCDTHLALSIRAFGEPALIVKAFSEEAD